MIKSVSINNIIILDWKGFTEREKLSVMHSVLEKPSKVTLFSSIEFRTISNGASFFSNTFLFYSQTRFSLIFYDNQIEHYE